MKNFLLKAAALPLGILAASGASAAVVPCSNSDIAPTALSCSGFDDGNLLNNANIAAQRSALADLGLANWDGTVLETLSSLSGSRVVNFNTLLTGISYIGVHFGNGRGGPGNGTAFYKLDAGAGLDSIGLNFNASSNARLFATGVSSVPEPGSWALMLFGFGGVGYGLRRRKAAVRVPAAA